MTEYALAPNRKFDVANSPYRTPRVMLEQGLLEAYRVRSNGTMRHIDLVPLGSTARETAEYVSDRVEMDGASVQAVAGELHVSTATVRRFLETLELTEEIEAGDWDDLIFDSQGMPVFSTPFGEDEEAAELAGCGPDSDCAVHGSGDSIAADQPCPQAAAEEIVDLLDNAPTVADLIEANSKGTDVAPRPARTRRTRPTRTTEEIIRGQGLPFPTDEERAAALADVAANLRAAGAPEPERTAEYALDDTKPGGARALANTVNRVTPAASRKAPIAACFCGGLGQHAPGAMPTCKFAGSGAALLRKPRSHG